MKRTRGDSVEVWNVSTHDRAETVQIEVRVHEGERIERPFDSWNPAAESIFPLRELQEPTNAGTLVLGKHGGEMGVQVQFVVARRHEGESKANLAITVEYPNDLTAGFRRDDEHIGGNEFTFGKLPHFTLDSHALFEFAKGGAGTESKLGTTSLRPSPSPEFWVIMGVEIVAGST